LLVFEAPGARAKMGSSRARKESAVATCVAREQKSVAMICVVSDHVKPTHTADKEQSKQMGGVVLEVVLV
jgi:hypothetical protein